MYRLVVNISRIPRSMVLALVLLLLCMGLAACASNSGVPGGDGNWQASDIPDKPIHALAVDPNNPQNIFVASNHGTVFVSTNAGDHWSERDSGLPRDGAIHTLVFADSGKKLYAATARGLFTSVNAGQTWSAISSSSLPVDEYVALTFDLNAPQVLYLGTAHHGVFASKDGGSSWTSINNGLASSATINGLAYDSDQQQLWAATSQGVFRTDNHGQSWQVLNNGLPVNSVVYTVQPASVSGGTQGLVYVGTQHGFFSSQNAGERWTPGQDTLSGLQIYAILIDFRSSNGKSLYVGSNVGVLKSDDRGQSWNIAAPGLPKGTTIYGLAFGGDHNSRLYATGNTVYVYPGSGSGNIPSNIFTIILFLGFFGLLYYISQRGRRRRFSTTKTRAASKQDVSSSSE